MRSLQFDGTMRVPQGYRDIFTRAEITFLHQRVFCPRERKLVHCNEPDSPLEDEHLIYVGPDLDEHIARGVAYGQLDPMTKTPLQAPHTVNTVCCTVKKSLTNLTLYRYHLARLRAIVKSHRLRKTRA